MGLRKIQIAIASVILGGICLTGFSQESKKNEERESLNREMTLEREYDPIVQDAAKVTTLPAIREINITKRPITYSDYAVPMVPAKEMNLLPPGKLKMDFPHTKYDGYLHFSGGMLLNFMGDVGYHILNTERDRLGLFFSHRSTYGNVNFEDKDIAPRKAKINDNIGGLDFNHQFDRATLSLGGQFGYSAFNYYGEPTNEIPLSLNSFYPPSIYPLKNDTVTNQGNRLFNVYGGIASDIPAYIGYYINAEYTNFHQKYSLSKELYGMTENHMALNLGMRSKVNNDQCFGADLKINMLSYKSPALAVDEPYSSALIFPVVTVDSTAFNTHFNATLNPYYRLENNRLKLILGANLMLVSQNDITNFFVSPNITLDIPFAYWNIFYANFGGGIASNSMAELSRFNRYLNPAFTPDASRTWADLKIGLRSSAVTGFWFDLFAGYKYTESDVFFNPSSYLWINDGFNNVSLIFQPTSQRIQGGVTLKYDYQHIFDIYIKGVYDSYTLIYIDTWKNRSAVKDIDEKSELKPYGKPDFVGNAGINVRPIKPLTFNLDYCMMSGMYAHNFIGDDLKMKTIHDLRFRSSWIFNDMFSIYAQFNNVLFQKQSLYYGYPILPFSAMAGFNVHF